MIKKIFLIAVAMTVLSCTKEEIIEKEVIVPVNSNVELYDHQLLENSYVLAIENGGFNAFLMNKQGFKVKDWIFPERMGNDIEILPNGKLLGTFKSTSNVIGIGGASGIIKVLNSDGSVFWSYVCCDANKVAHHDVEMLPNGNVLFLVWEKITPTDALNYGIETSYTLYPEALYEVNTTTNQLVWQWHSFNHVVQDTNAALPNYGTINQNPNKINFKYVNMPNGDIMHANGIDYDENKDVIYMSVNFYSEVWVIDHSTTTAQAATSSGGNYNKGGDLIYRFGNPTAYNHTSGVRTLFNNHYPNLIERNVSGKGNMLIYNNGSNVSQSTVYEVKLPQNFGLSTTASNEPTIVWSFTDPNLYYDKLSGAERLKNGNTLITEGDYGYWEVTPNKKVVWKYKASNITVWRGYNYYDTDPAIINLAQ
jgi:hypothetical protein